MQITPDASYMIGGNKISVKTLDLNCDFKDIAAQLDRLVEDNFEMDSCTKKGIIYE